MYFIIFTDFWAYIHMVIDKKDIILVVLQSWLQRKYWPPWTDSYREQKSGADINRFHDLFLHIRYVIWLDYGINDHHMMRHLTLLPCLSGKFGAFFASIPLPIFGAIYCVVLGIVGMLALSTQVFPFLFLVFVDETKNSLFFCSCHRDLIHTVCKS